jgi:two-component system, NtrC family, sensor kinase
VLDAIVGNAARLCSTDDVVLRLIEGDTTVARAHVGTLNEPPERTNLQLEQWQWVNQHGSLHIPDCFAQDEFPAYRSSAAGVRTRLIVPLLRLGRAVGYLVLRRTEMQPFSERQIKLMETFAAQAVIAIENTRLFTDLQKSLERQTGTSEVLGVIARSPTDTQQVFATITEAAARVCHATYAVLRLVEGDDLRMVAHYGTDAGPGAQDLVRVQADWSGPQISAAATAVAMRGTTRSDRRVAYLPSGEIRAFPNPELWPVGHVSVAVPLMKGGEVLGALFARRYDGVLFDDSEVALLETFADQAVIALENSRLFHDLQESLEQQTATSEVLGIISRSPTDVQPVFDAIVESAARACGVDDLVLRLHEGNLSRARAHFGPLPAPITARELEGPLSRWVEQHGTLQVPDTLAQSEFTLGRVHGARTFLIVPLRHHGAVIGTLNARRMQVRPFSEAQIKLL